jgi:uncharacterized protein (TIGR04551 family)
MTLRNSTFLSGFNRASAALILTLVLSIPAAAQDTPEPVAGSDAAEKKAVVPTTAPKPAADDLEKMLKKAATSEGLGGWVDKAVERPRSYPYFEHHGYFRFRADLFYNGHLGTVVPGEAGSGTSAVKAPLTENEVNNTANAWIDAGGVSTQDATTIAGANLRLRYQPTVHLSSKMRIHTTLDLLDNLVLGSTPDYQPFLDRPDVPLVAFSGSQVPPSAGMNGQRDSIRVTEAFAEWQPAFLLRMGRMRSHWGLGLLANGGQKIDDDYGDYSDRVLLLAKLYGVYVAAAYDFVFTGAITDDPGDTFGQPRDLGDADDVQQYVLSFFQRPLSAKEKEQRQIDLYENLKPQFDWGLYTVFRQQELDLDSDSYAQWKAQGGKESYEELSLLPRNAWAVIPDLWLRFEQRFNYFSGLRLELEAVSIIGEIENAVDDATTATKSRSMMQWGAALEVEYQHHDMKVGINAGVASGDSARGFGVEDQPTLSVDGVPNKEVTNFKFDRNYHVDLILFREVIGTVTNALYVKPFIEYDLFSSVEDALGARLEFMYAQALEVEATPGCDLSDPAACSSFLGFETDLRVFYEEKGRFNFDIEAGLLVPGEALKYLSASNSANDRDPTLAFTIQSRLTLQF